MTVPSLQEFKIELDGKQVNVLRQGDAHTPVFYIEMDIEAVQVQMETDGNGKEHWRQLPGGETELAQKIGIAIENTTYGI